MKRSLRKKGRKKKKKLRISREKYHRFIEKGSKQKREKKERNEEMLELDQIILNEDRHFHNIAMILHDENGIEIQEI